METTFQLEIQIENDVFSDNPSHEVARIFRELAQTLDAGSEPCGNLFANGNRVGWYGIGPKL